LRLQEFLRRQHVKFKPHGRHFLIQMDLSEELETGTRLTQFPDKTFGAAFKAHTGRSEPLPDEGARGGVIEAVTCLCPFVLNMSIYLSHAWR